MKPKPLRKKLIAKKGSINVLVGLLISIISFASILYVVSLSHDSYNIDEQIAMTRASLLVAEKTEVGSVFRADLYLKTHFFPIPEKSYGSSKEEVLKNIAERIKDCWWEFGNGQVSENVLDGVLFKTSSDKCFICFVPTIEKLDQPFYFSDILKYMAENPAAAKEKDMCVKEEKDDDKREITLSKKEGCNMDGLPECEAKGGSCRVSNCKTEEVYYPEWECQYNRKCCVPRDQVMSYLEYIQDGGGILYISNEFVGDHQREIKEGDALAIIFKDKTKSKTSGKTGAVTLIGGGAAIGLKLGGIQGMGIGTGIGTIVYLGSAIPQWIMDGNYPQGVIISPYPAKDYSNCMMVDPEDQ